MSMEYFCCFHDYRQKLSRLTDEETGRLFRALLLYSETGEASALSGPEAFAFDFIAGDIDRAKRAYEKKCTRGRETGRLGGRPKKGNPFFKTQEEDKYKDKDQYKDKYKKTASQAAWQSGLEGGGEARCAFERALRLPKDAVLAELEAQRAAVRAEMQARLLAEGRKL